MGKVFQYILFTANIVIWVGGSIMLGLGVWAITQDTEYKHLAGNQNVNITYILVASFIFVTGLLGACAICTIKQGLLKLYFGLVFTMFVAELAIAIYIYLERDKIPSFIRTNWNSTTDGVRILIQDKLKCCSLQPVIEEHPSSYHLSCFVDRDKTKGRLQDCYTLLRDWLRANYIALATCSALVATFQMFVLGGTCRLLAKIETADRVTIRQNRVKPFNPEMAAAGGTNKRQSRLKSGQRQNSQDDEVSYDDSIDEISLAESEPVEGPVLQSNTIERKTWAKHSTRYTSMFTR